jgi:CheY-like chemotaxis protein
MQSAGHISASEEDPGRIQILLVEDDPDMRLLIESTLSSDPRVKSCLSVSSGLAAIAAVEKSHPALVILDQCIEGEITGLDVAPMIKKVAPDTRILLFTSQDLSAEASLQPAIDLFLQKKNLKGLLCAAFQLAELKPLTLTGGTS